MTLAWASCELGEVTQAHHLLAPFIAQIRAAQMRLPLAGALRVQAVAYIKEERWQEAEQALDEALVLSQAMPDPYDKAKTLYTFGQLSLQQGAPKLARERFFSAQAILEKLGEHLYTKRVEQAPAAL